MPIYKYLLITLLIILHSYAHGSSNEEAFWIEDPETEERIAINNTTTTFLRNYKKKHEIHIINSERDLIIPKKGGIDASNNTKWRNMVEAEIKLANRMKQHGIHTAEQKLVYVYKTKDSKESFGIAYTRLSAEALEQKGLYLIINYDKNLWKDWRSSATWNKCFFKNNNRYNPESWRPVIKPLVDDLKNIKKNRLIYDGNELTPMVEKRKNKSPTYVLRFYSSYCIHLNDRRSLSETFTQKRLIQCLINFLWFTFLEEKRRHSKNNKDRIGNKDKKLIKSCIQMFYPTINFDEYPRLAHNKEKPSPGDANSKDNTHAMLNSSKTKLTLNDDTLIIVVSCIALAISVFFLFSAKKKKPKDKALLSSQNGLDKGIK